MNAEDQFKKNGYKLIGPYNSCDKPCLCACLSCGQEKEICLHNIKKIKTKCRNCYNMQVKDYFEKQGCKLISPPSRHKKMNYICVCGGQHSVFWQNFKNGTRCRKCLSEKLKKEGGMKQAVKLKIKDYFKEQGCKLLGEYKGQYEYLDFVCSCGREGKVRWKQFRTGSRCEHCAKEKIKNRFVPSGPNHSKWNPDREEVLLNKKVRSKIKKSLKRVLNETKKDKIKKTFEHLGYSKEDLIKHIKNQPDWHLLKNLEWELDHKLPMKAFFDHGIYDEKIINSLDNLQVLTKIQNRSKNDRYSEEDFINFIRTKGIISD